MVAVVALKLAVVDRTATPLRRTTFSGEAVAQAQTPLRLDFAGGLGLYGYDISARALPADGLVVIRDGARPYLTSRASGRLRLALLDPPLAGDQHGVHAVLRAFGA